jgi:subtilisin family serine protease
MQRIQSYCLRTAATVAGSALMALPAAAITIDDVVNLCVDFMENHLNDPEWEAACFDAMEEVFPEQPPTDEAAAETPPPPVFPIAQTAIVEGPHDGDRDSILDTLRTGQSVDIIVEFEVSGSRDEIHTRALEAGLRSLDAGQLAEKRAAYASIKQDGLAEIEGVTILRDYENLPTSFVRVSSEGALNSLIERPEVKAVFENRVYQHFLAQSLPLIEQPAAAAAGLDGAGTTVAVLDTGVNFGHAAFGSCTSPGIPAGCRVVDTFEAAPNDFSLDDSGHGTNVSAIAAGTAGDADLVVADVFDGAGAAISDIQAAISWAIAIQSTFNVVAMNLSLGDTSKHTTPCTTDLLATPLADALAAGIQPVIASGNTAFVSGSYVDGIAAPACVPAAVSVGAVYDANVGGLVWGSAPFQCTDSTTTADKLGCFSQSAPILSLLAPGALITAGGFVAGGTS